MNDIDKLEGDALNRAVAEALGYRYLRPQWMDAQHIKIMRPDGAYIKRDNWAGGFTDVLPVDSLTEWLPDYAHDLNAALALPCGYATLTKDRQPNSEDTIWKAMMATEDTVSINENAATAYSRAWLKREMKHAAQADDRYDERRTNWRQGDAL